LRLENEHVLSRLPYQRVVICFECNKKDFLRAKETRRIFAIKPAAKTRRIEK